MRTIIAGSRNITDYWIIESIMLSIDWQITEVVSGTAKGVDKLGERWAIDNNIPVKQFPANWGKYGKGAGFVRNLEMAGYADCLIAIWDGKSKGTKHMMDCAKKNNLRFYMRKLDEI